MRKLYTTISIFVLAAVLAAGSGNSVAQIVFERIAPTSVAADRQKAAVGSSLKISGDGFHAGEAVTLRAVQILSDDLRQTVAEWAVSADAGGEFATEWTAVFEGTFIVQAQGMKSGKLTATAELSILAPVVLNGNPSCATLNASNDTEFAHITQSWGLKLEPPAGGTFPFTNGSGRSLTGGAPADGANRVSILNLTETTFDWSASKMITAVIVKGGPNANVYPYDPESMGDALLTTADNGGFGISHIEFCFQNTQAPATVTIIKDAQPNTTQSFSFGATGQVSQNFNLVDNGAVGPDRITFNGLNAFGPTNAVTVTEGISGGFYQLTQINCSSTVTNNNTISLATRSATIVLEPGENVVCTFVNTVVTAAAASVAGRVVNDSGRPLVRAIVSIRNTSTGEVRHAYTNQFGRYRIEDLAVGDLYVATVEHKKRSFVRDLITFTLNDVVEDLDFTAIAP